jgi:hypothetical protein
MVVQDFGGTPRILATVERDEAHEAIAIDGKLKACSLLPKPHPI